MTYKHERKNEVIVDSIDLNSPYFNESAEINTLNMKSPIGSVNISVYMGEGSIPHFHVYTPNKKFETCVKLMAPEYFIHGKYTDKLNSRQCKLLHKALSEKSKRHPKMSVWEVMCFIWNSDQSNPYIIPDDFEMPKYSELYLDN